MEPRFTDIVCRRLKYLPAGTALEPDSDLGELGLDSMGAVALLLDIEEEFDCSLPDDQAMQETFRTAGNLWAALESVRAKAL